MIRTMMSLKEVGRVCVSLGGEIVSHRTFSKKIIPRLPVVSEKWKKRLRKQKEREEDKEYEREVTKDAKHAFAEYGDVPNPDLKQIGKVNHEEIQQRKWLDTKMIREKAFRQNFKSLAPKELNLLTYAEKEKIRYLHEESPEEWTPEALSESFPISPEGVCKILNSTFKARSLKEIQNHDQRVSETIEKVKSGEIPSTPELEDRMKMRQQVPFISGAVGPNSSKMLMKAEAPIVLGEFARLVASPELIQASLTQEIRRTPMPAIVGKSDDGPADGDSFMLKSGADAAYELRQLNISPRKPMTLSEFKSELKDVSQPNSTELMTAADAQNASNLVNQGDEIKYIKNYSRIDENPNTFSVPSDEMGVKYEDEDYLNYHSISKYKNSIRQQLEKREVEMIKEDSSNQSHQSEMTNHYELQNSWDPRNIDVPTEMRRPGALYKQGKSYFDENGVFLYRVV